MHTTVIENYIYNLFNVQNNVQLYRTYNIEIALYRNCIDCLTIGKDDDLQIFLYIAGKQYKINMNNISYSIEEFQEIYNDDPELFQLSTVIDCEKVLLVMKYIKNLSQFIENIEESNGR